ncbi:MAG: SDR family oxidoreductase [Deltaproteobacteria bacterium]|nr:MAG: SDR family oxidoreductase [Deltaproteobacteria bacterium]TMA84971.1 MAG: SDR family oxidoreductase [Deltaproteobacteria bacterium]TMB11192.1 MAG: SDR family oxidoreductase [Deltaproteobacteria bacterium]
MDLGLRGAAAVVNGGTGGMGRATAECFAADGARVAIFGRTQSTLDETVRALRELGSPDAVGLRVDVGITSQVDAAFAELGQRWGELNILVNTVGPHQAGRIEELSDNDWVAAFNLGALSAMRCARAALPWLRKAEWARIVNVSAHSTKRQVPILIAYTAAKSAMTSLSKNLAKTLARDGILVNTVSPGTFLSESVRRYVESVAGGRGIDPDDPVDAMRVIGENFASPCDLGRAGLPGEIGAVIAFLASKRNSYMTGADVNVDGGSDFA